MFFSKDIQSDNGKKSLLCQSTCRIHGIGMADEISGFVDSFSGRFQGTSDDNIHCLFQEVYLCHWPVTTVVSIEFCPVCLCIRTRWITENFPFYIRYCAWDKSTCAPIIQFPVSEGPRFKKSVQCNSITGYIVITVIKRHRKDISQDQEFQFTFSLLSFSLSKGLKDPRSCIEGQWRPSHKC